MKLDNDLTKEIIQWDVKTWANALEYWKQKIEYSQGLKCLEIGARNGGLSLWAALHGHNVICSDLSNPEKTARPLHDKYKVTEKISYEDVDILNIGYENHFDIIFLKSVLPSLGHMEGNAQKEALLSIHKALKSGGALMFAENLEATKLHMMLRKRFVSWGSGVKYMHINDVPSLFGHFKNVDSQILGFSSVLGRTESQRRVLSKLDKLLVPMIPDSWKFLIVGIAVK